MHITKRDLAALAKRELTKTALAERLGISATYLSRITPKLPPGPVRAQRAKTKELSDMRKAIRSKLAKQVANGRRSIESAAKEAKCSVRTIYRYLPCKSKT